MPDSFEITRDCYTQRKRFVSIPSHCNGSCSAVFMRPACSHLCLWVHYFGAQMFSSQSPLIFLCLHFDVTLHNRIQYKFYFYITFKTTAIDQSAYQHR